MLSAAALLLLLTSRAEAAPISLLLTLDYYTPTVGPPEIGINFRFFTAATDGCGVSPAVPRTALVTGGASLLPGVSQFNVALNVDSLDNVYFNADGSYLSVLGPSVIPGQFFYSTSIYVAEPPTGYVSDGTANQYGPPWIPLANLGSGFSGDFHYIMLLSRPNRDVHAGSGPSGTHRCDPRP